MKHEIVVTQRMLTMMQTRELIIRCRKCAKEIHVGDEITSSPTGRNCTRKWYHRTCWKEMFI